MNASTSKFVNIWLANSVQELCCRKRDNNSFWVAAWPEGLKYGHFAVSRRVIVMFVFSAALFIVLW